MKKKNNHKESSKTTKPQKDFGRLASFLSSNGIRPTRQRLGLSSFLFDGHDHHVKAEQLMEVAKKRKLKISLATVYNTLHEFVRHGILKEVCSDGTCRYFDTNLENHSHFFDEKAGHLWDIEPEKITVSLRQAPPKGMKIDHVRLVVFLKKFR